VAAKDNIGTINEITVEQSEKSQRVPPPLMGLTPKDASTFGAVEPAANVFNRNELIPLQSRLEELNDWIGEGVVRFREYVVGAKQ